MRQAAYILFGAALTLASAYGLGSLLLWRLAIRLYREEELVVRFVCGSALLSTIVFAICAAGGARKGVFLALGSLVLLLCWRTHSWRRSGDSLPPAPCRWKCLFWCAYSVFGFLYFSNAMAPEFSPDGVTYHLGLVARYLREHGFHRIATNMYANLSQGTEMLFLFAFSIGRHSAAALVHCGFLMTLPLAMWSYARRFGFPAAGVVGAIFAFASPIVGIDGISAYNDVAVACVLFTLFLVIQIWIAEKQRGLLIVIGLLAGFAFAIKYTAALAIVYACAMVLWHARRPRPALIVAGCAALMFAPWMVKNYVLAGNPVSPFLNTVFPNPYVHPDFERDYRAQMRHFNDVKDREIPLETTIHGLRLGGLVGPLFLLVPLSLLALRWPAGRQLLLAAAVFTLSYAGNIGTRFLIPSLPFWSLAMALAFRNAPAAAVSLAIAHMLASWPSNIPLYADASAWRLERIPTKAALRLVPEERFLLSKTRGYLTARMIDGVVPPGGKVFTFGQNVAEAYTSRDILVGFQSAFNASLRDALLISLIEDYQSLWPREFHFTPRPLRHLRVTQTAARGLESWSVMEFRILSAGTDIPRDGAWRVRANPNPWDVQKAFDNSYVTRWSAHHSLYPGMFIEVDLGRAVPMDLVRLECSRDQYQVRLKLEGAGEDGQWRALGEAPADGPLHSQSGLRRAATAELKRAGVNYIEIEDSDFGADDFHTNARQWGLKLLDEKGGARIYHIE
ncbi:MAG TPA: glycosyltransferase family 39 protein [Bryobacteraceae bacterium]|nr:glycosyltransferase family 39 protein [Bryobacteraceae bacterium]